MKQSKKARRNPFVKPQPKKSHRGVKSAMSLGTLAALGTLAYVKMRKHP